MENNSRYYVVDKETGEVVGETNSKKDPPHPFKRILAFVVLYVISLAVRFISYQYIRLVVWILDEIYGLNKLIYYIILFAGGATATGILIWILMLGAHIMILLPEKIIPSRKGVRYMVLGIIVAVFYLISLISMLTGFSSSSALQYVWHIVVIIFFVVIIFMGKAQSES